jgi:hypothetical protein
MGRAAKKNSSAKVKDAAADGAGGEEMQAAIKAKIAQLSVKEEITPEEARELARSAKTQEKEITKLAESDASLEDKIKQLREKSLSLLQASKNEQRDALLYRRKSDHAAKDKESAILEMNRAVSVKENLETLCRELQRQNKLVMEESRNVADQEQQKRQDLSDKFQTTISDVSTRLDEQGKERIQQFQENERLKEKLKTFAEQYELREQQFAHQLKTKDLEHQLVQAKLNHQQEIGKQEGTKLEAYQKELETRLLTEKELRQQLVVYNEKFETFQETLSKSNEVFGTFKKEMDKMSKTIRKQDKENLELKKKAQKCDLELISLYQERDQYKGESEKAQSQNSSLQSLCKTLQEERKKHLASVKSKAAEVEAAAAEEEESSSTHADL